MLLGKSVIYAAMAAGGDGRLVGATWTWRDQKAMPTRTTSKIVTFALRLKLRGIEQKMPAGNYRVVTDEELIEELSFRVYRRVSMMMFVPAKSASSVEMVAIDPQELSRQHRT